MAPRKTSERCEWRELGGQSSWPGSSWSMQEVQEHRGGALRVPPGRREMQPTHPQLVAAESVGRAPCAEGLRMVDSVRWALAFGCAGASMLAPGPRGGPLPGTILKILPPSAPPRQDQSTCAQG